MDEMGTGGGLHEDLWGSVRYSLTTTYTLAFLALEVPLDLLIGHGKQGCWGWEEVGSFGNVGEKQPQ